MSNVFLNPPSIFFKNGWNRRAEWVYQMAEQSYHAEMGAEAPCEQWLERYLIIIIII